jgi:hypothetical protein
MIQSKLHFKTAYINFMQNSLSSSVNRDDRGYLMAYFDNNAYYTAPKDSNGNATHYKMVLGGFPIELVQHANLYIYALNVIKETETVQDSTYDVNLITDDPYDDSSIDNYINIGGKVSLVEATYNSNAIQHPTLPLYQDLETGFSDPYNPFSVFYYDPTDSIEHLKRIVWQGVPMGQTSNGSIIMVEKDITDLIIDEERSLMLNGCPIKVKRIGTKWYLCVSLYQIIVDNINE